MTGQTVEVHGVEPCDQTGPFGDDEPYIEHLRVTAGGETLKVPVTDVRLQAYHCFGNPPDWLTALDFDRVRQDEDVFAETFFENGHCAMINRQYRPGMERGRWQIHYIEDPVDGDFDTLWRRDE